MKRLIDEEDAIRAICKNCYAEDGGDYKDCRYYPCDDVQAIEALPSTDVERIKDIMKKANEQDKHMGRPTDLIRRADAIEAVIAQRHRAELSDYNFALGLAEDAIRHLPSAEAVSRDAIISAKFHPLPYTHITPADVEAESYKRGWNDALDAVADNAPSAEAVHESCEDCPLYDKEKHNCPRFNKVIPRTIAEAVQGWIPCSERLPKELEAVNVTWVNHNPPVYYQHIKDVPKADTAVYYRGTWYWWDATVIDLLGEYGGSIINKPIDKDIEVTAWMPLPEAYKGGDSE